MRRANEAIPRNAELGPNKTVRYVSGLDAMLHPKVFSRDTLFIFFKSLAFEAKGCTNLAEPNTVHLFAEDIFGRRNPPCNAEDNTKAELIIIEDRFRGY